MPRSRGARQPAAAARRRRMRPTPTTPPIRPTPTSRTSAACKPRRSGSIRAAGGSGGPFSLPAAPRSRRWPMTIPAATLIVVATARPAARAADGRAQRRHGVRRRSPGLSRRPDRRSGPTSRASASGRDAGGRRGDPRDDRGNRDPRRPHSPLPAAKLPRAPVRARRATRDFARAPDAAGPRARPGGADRRSRAGSRSSTRCAGSTRCSSSPAAPPGDWPPNVIAGECAGAPLAVGAADVLERDGAARRG